MMEFTYWIFYKGIIIFYKRIIFLSSAFKGKRET